ncbi:MAG: DUF4249 domain-containing protein [Flavobacteriales bacterium]
MKNWYLFSGFVVVLLFQSCTKEVDIEVPAGEEKIVVEGFIETGQPPIVILTRNKPYFGTNNFNGLSDLIVKNAIVTVTNNGTTYTLLEICTSTLPDSLLPLVTAITGIDSATLASIDYCLYTTFDINAWGVEGEQYDLKVVAEGKTLTASTEIPFAVALDSVWYKDQDPHTDRGFCWARLDDPDTIGNAYRWFAMRKGKDYGFLAPFGSAFEDKFINGQSFEFTAVRAHASDDELEENADYRGYFRTGDTIIVKFTTIDLPHYQFWRTYETQVISNGNPFAAPAAVKSNITGGLGIWGGYAVRYDTTVAQ